MSLVVLLAVAGLSAWAGTGWVRRNASRLGLVSVPNGRSSHALPTPHGGGIGIVLAGSLSGGWLARGEPAALPAALGLALTLAAVGLLDDIHHLSARLRFVMQMAVCGGLLLCLPGDLVLPGLLLLAGVWWINLFNFMDGIDGIAGVQAVFMLLAGAALAAWGRPEAMVSPVWALMLCVAAATAGFLLFNWPPARIFMGDVGSTWLAFMILALALLSVQAGWLSHAAWLVLGAVFVADATVTLLIRMVRGERWHEAHRSHAYQRLSRRWRDRKTSHRAVTLLVAAIDLFWLAPLAWACLAWPQWAPAVVALAYAPLVVGAMASGAGRPDDA